ncbi:MAG: hypothetical protein CMP66_04505 [Flavobacteriales bacterium]|nr:hypothetical protein [Flavobacteriales bacterium]
MNNSTLVLCLFLFFSMTNIYSQSTNEDLSNIFKDAYLSAENQNYDQAIEKYSNYINLSSFEDSVAIAFYNRGHSYFAISNFQNAYDDFDTTITILSNLDSLKKIPRLTALAFNYRGLCCENLGMLDEASIDFFIAQLSDTTLFQPVFNGAMNCEAREVYDTAIDEYYRAIYLNLKYSNDIDALLHMLYRAAMLSRKLENYENAIQDFEMYLSIDSTNVDVINKLGNTYASMKNEEKALSCYLKAIEYNPNFQDAIFNTGVAYLKLGDNSKSIKYIRKAIKLNDKNSDYYKTLGVAMLISNEQDGTVYDFCYQFEKTCDFGDCEYLNQYCF